VRSIAWLSEKGGVGKTTIAVNTAVAMAKSGRRVLFVDVDPQANASMIFQEGRAGDGPTLFHVLTNEAEIADSIRSTSTENLDLVAADGLLADANVLLVSQLGREKRLRVAIQSIAERYDILVCDTSPQRSLLSVNVLNAVDDVYCPVDPGIFAIAGLVKLQEAIAGVVKFLDNPTLRLAGLVVSRVQRDNLSRDTESQLRTAFGPLVMKATVPASTKIGEAHAHLKSVLDYAPGTVGAVAFESLAREMIDHGEANGARDGVDGVAQVDVPGRGGRRRRAG
jgi:chromosome partitioning protein